jgi:hypothetical protein
LFSALRVLRGFCFFFFFFFFFFSERNWKLSQNLGFLGICLKFVFNFRDMRKGDPCLYLYRQSRRRKRKPPTKFKTLLACRANAEWAKVKSLLAYRGQYQG